MSKHDKDTRKLRAFQAILERMRSRLNWVIIRVPFDAGKVFGKRGQIKIKGEINGFPFRTALFPTGTGGHILLVNKKMQKGGNVRIGGLARFSIEQDFEKQTFTTPDSLKRILAEERSLQRWFDQLSKSRRNEIAKWINEPRSEEARTRRAEQVCERLMETMEAERELPPLVKVALARNAEAEEGWKLMSVARRRSHLLGIFYYRTPESRMRRMEQMLQDAAALVQKANKKRGFV